MNPKKLELNFQEKKDKFHNFINNIKENMKVDIYSIINTTLICNPYETDFPKKFFIESTKFSSKILEFFRTTIIFYIKNVYSFFLYIISYVIFNIYYEKKFLDSKKYIGLDIFFLVNNIINEKNFNDRYFAGIYDILDKYKKNYIFIPRIYGASRNPFKLINFFKIINEDKRNFLFEFELLSLKDFLDIFFLILNYPFKTLKLLQKENSFENRLFNNELIVDIRKQQFSAFSRYIFGKKIAQTKIIDKIYSWSEFQVIERSFNYGIRSKNKKIKLIGCQFFLNYETYFNSIINDIDAIHLYAPHKVLVNGKYYLKRREKVEYKVGVSLRYKNLFEFKGIEEEKSIVLLGSYFVDETKYMIECVRKFEKIIFKNHPVVNIKKFGKLPSNIVVSNRNIYDLFKYCKLVISSESGSLLEAVACGISVIVIANNNSFTANPLVEYGKGKIWDIIYSKNEIVNKYEKLMKFRKDNKSELEKISKWYKDNFFVEPTEENIVKIFEIKEEA